MQVFSATRVVTSESNAAVDSSLISKLTSYGVVRERENEWYERGKGREVLEDKCHSPWRSKFQSRSHSEPSKEGHSTRRHRPPLMTEVTTASSCCLSRFDGPTSSKRPPAQSSPVVSIGGRRQGWVGGLT